MASQLTRDEVAHIAGLAQLELSVEELDVFARQLTDILAYAASVQRVDDGPAARATAATTTVPSADLRADTPVPSLDRDAALAAAPEAAGDAGLFRVPKVL